jgi:hypothetical protein
LNTKSSSIKLSKETEVNIEYGMNDKWTKEKVLGLAHEIEVAGRQYHKTRI